MLKKFTYTKKENDVSERTVVVIHPASDCFLCLDLSTFSEEDQKMYASEVKKLQDEFNDGIKKLGLAGCWRQFKADKMDG